MSRYDTQLAVERGQVRSGMSPNRNDYWSAADRARSYRPREAHYWRRPAELRGDVRGGSAFTYGFGDDYDVAYRGARGGRGGGQWLGAEGFPGEAGRRYGRDFRNWNARGRPAWGGPGGYAGDFGLRRRR